MKIAMVSPYSWAHPGGVNNHILGTAREMRARGHRVTVVAPDSGAVPDGVAFTTAGRSIPVPANGSVAHIAVLPPTPSRLRRALGSGGFDVVHVHEPLVPLVSVCAVRAAQSRVVGTFHASSEGRSTTYALARLALKRVHARIDHCIAVSEPARQLANSYFEGEYDILPNGVDLDRFAPGLPRPERMPAADVPVVLFVGRNERRKGLGLLLEAFDEVLDAAPDAALVVVGEGYSDADLRGAPGRVRAATSVLGFVSNEELPAYYGAADVFCSPALGGESFGIVLIEAMASGTPVVASDIPGYRYVLEKSRGGCLFGSGDRHGLASALTGLLLDADLRERLSKAGLAGVTQFSWRVLADRLEEIYSGG